PRAHEGLGAPSGVLDEIIAVAGRVTPDNSLANVRAALEHASDAPITSVGVGRTLLREAQHEADAANQKIAELEAACNYYLEQIETLRKSQVEHALNLERELRRARCDLEAAHAQTDELRSELEEREQRLSLASIKTA